jgi:hypothetical protein
MGNLLDSFERWMTGLILLTLIVWIVYKSFKNPQKTKKFIFGGICNFFLIVGAYSIYYSIYTLFVGGFDLRTFWYSTLIPLTIGSTIIPSLQNKEVYPFWSILKNRITISGYLLIIWGIWECIMGIQDGQIMDKVDLTLIPLLCGLVPVMIDVYQQTDEETSK